MRVADTSALYAFFNREDPHHLKAKEAFEEPDTIWVPAEILTEMLVLIKRRAGPEAADAAGEYLWSQPNVEIQPSDASILMAAWGEYAAEQGRLTFADAVVVAASRELEAKALTFDRRIQRTLAKRPRGER